jgi:single stranded DNA-binding protein
MHGINKVIVGGRLTAEGPKLTYSPEGTPQCTFTVRIEEAGKDGATFKVFVPIDVFGAHAEWVAAHVNAGALVLVDGKLKWRSWVDKQGQKQGKLVLMGWQVTLVQPATPAAVSAH